MYFSIEKQEALKDVGLYGEMVQSNNKGQQVDDWRMRKNASAHALTSG